jgi:lipoprotein-anchoring transpeptidase ErfK/SrfK
MRKRLLCGLKIASGAALSAAALLALSEGANAQFYDRFDRFDQRYQRYERYDRYRRYDPRYDEPFDRQRNMRRYPADGASPPRETRRAKKQREAEPKHAAVTKPAKGPYQVIVSIASQRIYLYGAEGLIAQSKVSTGMRGHSTPSGVFSVLEKSRYHRSNIYSGAPMPMMQRLTWSGIALHEGVLPGYPASHGCIRMNREFATLLWNTTQKGARVIVGKGEIDPPAPITNAKLFSPIVRPAETVAAATSIAKSMAAEETKALAANTDGQRAETQRAEAQPVETPAEAVTDVRFSAPAAYKAPALPARKGTIAAFISRKTGKLHVRYAMAPLFEMPVEIKDKDRLIGTHVFTAIEPGEEGKEMSWQAVSIPTHPEAMIERRRSTRNKIADLAEKPALPDSGPQTAADALARIEIPKEAYQRIGELLTPGASLTISDYGISDETGEGTDFVVLTR